MPGTWIEVSADNAFRCYLAEPASGSGPGLLLLQDRFGVDRHLRDIADSYAEEGYVVLVPDLFWRQQPGAELDRNPEGVARAIALSRQFDTDAAMQDVATALYCLRGRPECTGQVGVIGFGLSACLAFLAAAHATIDCAIAYYGHGIAALLDQAASIRCRLVLHLAENDRSAQASAQARIAQALAGKPHAQVFVYAGCDYGFNDPVLSGFDKAAALMAHSRSIAALRETIGPRYDLSALWEAHTKCEFGDRDAAATMRTMVAQPYVNHIPTMTGGVGHDDLLRFYRHHFIPKTPADTRLVPISRTIGADRVVDEMLFCFTHDIEIDWMLPGVPPTGRYVEIPLVAIVRFRGDKLYNEHIYWDQASVLVQIGLLDSVTLPVAGVETARKVLDPKLPSNTLMKRWSESAGRPL